MNSQYEYYPQQSNCKTITQTENPNDTSQMVTCLNVNKYSKEVIIQKISRKMSISEIYTILKGLYSEYLQLASTNRIPGEYFTCFKLVILSIASIHKSICRSNRCLTKLLFYLMTIYTKHNQTDVLSIKSFILQYTGDILPNEFIKEVLRNENIVLDGFKGCLDTKNNDGFSLRLTKYLPKEFYLNDIIPSHTKMTQMVKEISIHQEGYRIKYKKGNSVQFNTVRSNTHIKSSVGIYYFEVLILSISDNLGIGLVNKEFDLNSKIPGLELNSIGYHSESGNVYNNTKKIKKYGPKYSMNDYAGCCINFIEKICFFTLNGVKLVEIPIKTSINYFPAVGMLMLDQEFQINYGQWNFCYDLLGYKKAKVQEYYGKIMNTIDLTEMSTYELLIADYLAYNGYEDTLNEFIVNSDIIPSHYLTQARIRKIINKFIAIRDYDSVEVVIKENFINFNNTLSILQLCRKVFFAYDDLTLNNGTISGFLSYIKLNIMSNDDYLLLKQLVPTCEDFIKDIFNLIIYPQEQAICQLKDIVNKYFNNDEIFSFINNSLQDSYSSNNQSNQINQSQLEVILKQLLQILSKGLKYNRLTIKFIFSNDPDFNILKQILRSKTAIPSEFSLNKTFHEYFDTLKIHDSSDNFIN